MVSLKYLVSLGALATHVAATFHLGHRPVVFNEILSIDPPEDKHPETPGWLAKVRWEINNEMGLKEGDYFTLHMPYVSKIEASVSAGIKLIHESKVYANCKVFSGANVVAFSELQCTCTAEVEGVAKISSHIEFGFAFNAGFAFDAISLAAATIWRAGENLVHWVCGGVKLLAKVHFEAGLSFTFGGSIDHGAYYLRKNVFLDFNQHYVLGPSCAHRGMSGYIEIKNPLTEVALDCKSLKASITSKINVFCFPLFALRTTVEVKECTATYAKVYVKNIPRHHRPYLNINAAVPKKDLTCEVTYSYNFKCGQEYFKESHNAEWKVHGNGNDNECTEVVMSTTTDCAASSTGLTSVYASGTETIIVTVPCSPPESTSEPIYPSETILPTSNWPSEPEPTEEPTSEPEPTEEPTSEPETPIWPTESDCDTDMTETTTTTSCETSDNSSIAGVSTTPSETVSWTWTDVPSETTETTSTCVTIVSTWSNTITSTVTETISGTTCVIVHVPSTPVTTITTTTYGTKTYTTTVPCDTDDSTQTVIVVIPTTLTESCEECETSGSSTVAGVSTTPDVSTFDGKAAANSLGMLALIMPLLQILI